MEMSLVQVRSARHVHVVTEVCLGGPLSGWMTAVEGDVSFAARCAREVGGALAYCHSRGVCHRDLKLENILLVRDARDSPLRVADFGLAKRCSMRVPTQRLCWHKAREASCGRAAGAGLADEAKDSTTPSDAFNAPGATSEASAQLQPPAIVRLTSFKGTLEYMAPEVIRILDSQVKMSSSGDTFYDFRCDVWSLGIVLHILLAGEPPFTVQEVSAFVAEGEPLSRELMPKTDAAGSESGEEVEQWSAAGDFVRLCLVPDFQARRSAAELLGHRWLRRKATTGISAELASEMASHLQNFCRRPSSRRCGT
mmetsp:Transcript_159214/g.510740  ORF Transcript_159214/g.510740 Transcript_159214/m.510740 type:complete len:310 (-) Transcript_159214:901-1830(-)